MLKRFTSITLLYITILLCLTSCITSEGYDMTNRGNFEVLWRTLDEHYCFFDYKAQEYGLDWNEVHDRYAQQFNEDVPQDVLFQILSRMTFELRDGHCNLASPSDVASYTEWYEAYPMNYSDSLQHKYLGTSYPASSDTGHSYHTTGGLKYCVLRDNIGYVRCSTFENSFGDGNLHYIFDYLGQCNGLIIDVRSNGGGKLTGATTLAGAFINSPVIGGYLQHKTGPGHNDFSRPEAITLTPAEGLRWQKPVVVLTNRRTYSAANAFTMFMRTIGATLIGDTTGGGSGMPFSSELPSGWSVRFSACPMTDAEGRHTEFGIAPDHHIDITDDDYQRGVDTILEYAIDFLKR